jgi:hypothetical protein
VTRARTSGAINQEGFRDLIPAPDGKLAGPGRSDPDAQWDGRSVEGQRSVLGRLGSGRLYLIRLVCRKG